MTSPATNHAAGCFICTPKQLDPEWFPRALRVLPATNVSTTWLRPESRGSRKARERTPHTPFRTQGMLRSVGFFLSPPPCPQSTPTHKTPLTSQPRHQAKVRSMSFLFF